VIGALVLVGTPIGNLGDLTPRAVAALRDATVIAAEDTRRTRALLTYAGIPAGRRLVALHAHNERQVAERLVDRMRSGERVAFVTDAGMPAISDPGERLVRVAINAGVPVEVVPGPSALLAALVISGLPAGRFAFEGFLPRKGRDRKARLAALAAEDRTILLYEAPHRLAETLAELAEALGPERPVAVARELTKVHEEIVRSTLAGAAAAASAGEPRGEHVLVIGPRPAPPAVTDEALEVAVRRALDRGLSVRDAAAEVGAVFGVAKRRAYEVATRLAQALGVSARRAK
jgi:16S rRNA (cytidine1402-2'-O)-methyltransferase